MKKLLSVVLSFMFLVSFTACSDKPVVIETNTKEITLYFPDNEALYLHPEVREVVIDNVPVERVIIDELIKGPTGGKLIPALVSGFEVLSVKTDNGICTINLSKEFSAKNTGGSAQETFAVYSLVNSLCELDGVERVKINIDGNEAAEFGGFILDVPFEADMDIVEKN